MLKNPGIKNQLVIRIKAVSPRLFTMDDLYDFSLLYKCKISNAERRLRELCEDPAMGIFSSKNEKGTIVGWFYRAPVIENNIENNNRMTSASLRTAAMF
jgi:hypothetical protein